MIPKRYRTLGDKLFEWINNSILCLFAFVTVYPFWSTLMVSFMDRETYSASIFNMWPKNFTLFAYKYIFQTDWIVQGFFNSVFYTAAGTLYAMTLVCLTAYATVKSDLVGRKIINTYFIVTMFFGAPLAAYYILYTTLLPIANTRLVMIVGGVGVWNVLVLRNFIRGLSPSLIESARIDGATEIAILGKIILPLSIPPIATLTMFSLFGKWNDWFTAQVFLTGREDLFPLQMVLRRVVLETTPGSQLGAVEEMRRAMELSAGRGLDVFKPAVNAALIMVVTLPIVAVYPFLQKYFEKGVLIGSLKE